MLDAVKQNALNRFVSFNALAAFGLNVTSQILGFVLFVILARMLGVEEFGLYILAWSWTRILLNFSKCGFDMAATKFIPAFREQGHLKQARSFFRYGLTSVATKSIAVTILAILTTVALQAFTNFTQQTLFITAFALLPIWSIILYLQSSLRAMRKIIAGLITESLIRPLLQIALILALPVIGIHTGAQEAFGATLIAFACALFISLIFSRKTWGGIIPPASLPPSAEEKSIWTTTAYTFVLIASGAILMKQADTVMIGAMLDTKSAGLYGAATRIAMLATFVLTAINMVVGPMISGLYHKGDRAALQSILRFSALLIAGGTSIIVIAILLLSPFILSLFGPDFAASNQALTTLLVAQAINALSGPVGYVMTMTGHHAKAAKIFAAMIILNIVLNTILIPIMGINGAAIATGFTTILWNVILLVYVHKNLKLNPTLLPIKHHD